jgi:hypothetical protein
MFDRKRLTLRVPKDEGPRSRKEEEEIKSTIARREALSFIPIETNRYNIELRLR